MTDREQLRGIRNRAGHAYGRTSYHEAQRYVGRLACVEHTTVVRHGGRSRLEVTVTANTIPPTVSGRLAECGLCIDPDQTASRPGIVVVVAE